jgi:hypothetical protein
VIRWLKYFKLLGWIGWIFTFLEWKKEADRLTEQEKLLRTIRENEGGDCDGQG